jgi:transposase-like protein
MVVISMDAFPPATRFLYGVQELLFECNIDVTYEAIRQWCLKFGQAYAHGLRRRHPRPGDKWHLDEVLLTIKGTSALTYGER